MYAYVYACYVTSRQRQQIQGWKDQFKCPRLHHFLYKAPFYGALCFLALPFPAGVPLRRDTPARHHSAPNMKSSPTY